jgi:uncharacterized protein involved in exopolysaccharide biosynthesis
MPSPGSSFDSPLALAGAVYRYRYRAALAFVGGLALTLAVYLVTPPKYVSEAKLFVRLGRETISLDPTATTGETIAVSETREVEVNSILEVLKSRAVLEEMVSTLTPQRVLGTASGSSATPVELEKAIQKLGRQIDAEAGRRSSVITLQTTANTPELAQQFASAYLKTYLDHHFRVHRTIGSYEFFVEQSRRGEELVQEATNRLRDVKNSAGLVSIESQRKLLQDQLSAIATQESLVEASLAASRAKVIELNQRVQEQPLRVIDDEVSGLPNVAGDLMRQRLYDLEIRDRELAAKYTDEHALRIAVRQQLADAQDVVAAQPAARTQSTGKLNRLRENLELALRTEQAAAQGLERQLATLRSQREAIYVRQQKLNDDELQIAALERQVALAEANLKVQNEKREEARINQALDTQRITNVNVVQQPSLVLKPVSPQKPLFAVGGVLFGLILAFTAALSSEYWRAARENRDDAEQELGLPVLIELPRTPARELVTADG